jgi:glutamate-ammonia-ligase adenylyltransferase
MSLVNLSVADLPEALQNVVQADAQKLFASWPEVQLAQLGAQLGQQGLLELVNVLAGSPFVGQQFARQPALLPELLDSGDLHRSFAADYWPQRVAELVAQSSSEDELALALRRLRTREQCRVIWRDLNRLADLIETTGDLSGMADACIDGGLNWLYADCCAAYGTPTDAAGQACHMVVLGMGKLGARELNLSSDIDLIFAFAAAGETRGGRRTLSNEDFFTRLGQRLIRLLDAHTGEGFVFRVDMRLRPYGQSGALALSFDALEEYYQTQGRDWERYAMIKARVVAGDMQRGAELMETLRPFVYRRYSDFSAIESLRDMKALIQREVQRVGKQDDVKLGPGGIREIEFIGQVFQLIRGGREPHLQERRLLTVLDYLADGDYMPAPAVLELQQAYIFLRNTEHAIQSLHDQQTQALPTDTIERARLAHAMGFADWSAFRAALDVHRARVTYHFAALIEPEEQRPEIDASGGEWLDLWLGNCSGEHALDWLQRNGFARPEPVWDQLCALRNSSKVRLMQAAGRERLDQYVPLMLAEVAVAEDPNCLFERLLPLLESVLRRTAYLVMLLENALVREQLNILCAASPWIASELARNPVLLDELHNVATLYLVPDKKLLRNELREQLLRFEWTDLEGHMQGLRYFRLAHVLRIAASEVTERMPLMKVSDYLTLIAEVILEHVLELAWRNLVARHGQPVHSDGSICDQEFIIVGYGKLGGIELGHASDLDLVFVHDVDANQVTNGAKPIAAEMFFTRLGQRIIHILTAATTLGPLYEVDMRLRPSGEAGLLVTSLRAFDNYQRNEAWTWEHQALVRARVVAGDASLGEAYAKLRQEILALPRPLAELRAKVCEMRQKMRDHLLPAAAETGPAPYFDLKHGSGGIVDIEFMVQFAVLAWAHTHPALCRWTDNIRILESLQQAGLLSDVDCTGLVEAYKSYRSCAHRLALQQQKSQVGVERFATERALVRKVWQQLMLDDGSDK